MMGRRHLPILALTGLSLLPSCGSDDEVLETGAWIRPPGDAVERDEARSRTPALPTLAPARGPFFDWLPKETCLALRVPQAGRLGGVLQGTALASAVAELGMGGRWSELIGGQLAELSSRLPEGLNAGALLSEFEGDVVVGVIAVHPEVLFGDAEVLPFTGVLYVGLGEDTGVVTRWIETCRRHLGGSPDFEGLTDGSVRGNLVTDACRFEVLVRDRVLALGFAPPGSPEGGLDRWMALAPEDSFRASALLRSLPDEPFVGEVVCAEVFLNLTPASRMALAMAPAEVQEALRNMQLSSLHGFSMIAGFDGSLVHEVVRMHAPGGQDALSRLLGTEEIDPAFARWIPADVHQGVLLAFEPERALNTLLAMMPAPARREIEEALQEAGDSVGIDLRAELLADLGPQMATALKGVPGNEDFQWSVAVQCRDTPGLRRRLLEAAGLLGPQRVHQTGEHQFYSVTLPATSSPILRFFEPCYAFVEEVLLLGVNPESMRRALTAAEAKGKLAPPELRAPARGTLSVSYADLEAQMTGLYEHWQPLLAAAPEALPFALPEEERWAAFCSRLGRSVGSLRRDDMGVVLDSRSTFGAGAAALGIGALVSASFSRPDPMVVRSDARELEIVATLLQIHAVQRRVKELALIDGDGDGDGEYAYFAELAGAVPVRGWGASLSPALLDAEFGVLLGGCVRRHGFLLRMDLPDRAGRPLSELSVGGAPRRTDHDGAESGWVVYAWPESADAMNARTYVIDETGRVFYTENSAVGQGYVGLANVPAGDASYLEAGTNRIRGRSVRRGQDRALWLEMELPLRELSSAVEAPATVLRAARQGE